MRLHSEKLGVGIWYSVWDTNWHTYVRSQNAWFRCQYGSAANRLTEWMEELSPFHSGFQVKQINLSHPFHFKSKFLLMSTLGSSRQWQFRRLASVTSESTPGSFSMAQPWLLQALDEWVSRWNIPLQMYLSVSLSFK